MSTVTPTRAAAPIPLSRAPRLRSSRFRPSNSRNPRSAAACAPLPRRSGAPAPRRGRPSSAAGRRCPAPQTRCTTAQSDPRPPPTSETVLDRDGPRSYPSTPLTATHGSSIAPSFPWLSPGVETPMHPAAFDPRSPVSKPVWPFGSSTLDPSLRVVWFAVAFRSRHRLRLLSPRPN
jgi:hypothetical protein